MRKDFRIWDGGEKALEKAIKRLNRHAAKMGYGECKILRIGEPIETRRTIAIKSDGEVETSSYAVLVREVEVDIPEQFLNHEKSEWSVIGQVVNAEGQPEVVSEGGNLIKASKAAEGFGWKCGTCGHSLGKAYVVEHKIDGQILLVGQECLKQYTGADGHAIIAAVEFLAYVEYKDGEDGEQGGGWKGSRYEVIDLDDYLAVALAVAEKDGGYIKRWTESEYGDDRVENVNCTRNKVLAHFDHTSKIEVSDVHIQKAAAQVEAWRNCYMPLRDGKPDEYVTQCKFLAERGWVTVKTAGIAASMVKEPPVPPKDYSGSKYLGTVGERQVFENLTVLMAIETEGDYGITTILKFSDVEDNILTWFASGCPGYQKGDKVSLKATVKKHDEYKGVKQTVITRAKKV